MNRHDSECKQAIFANWRFGYGYQLTDTGDWLDRGTGASDCLCHPYPEWAVPTQPCLVSHQVAQSPWPSVWRYTGVTGGSTGHIISCVSQL